MNPNSSRAAASIGAAFLATSLCAPFAAAQCPTVPAPGLGMPGVNDIVHVVHRWDPDGPGPQPELVVLGGRFDVAGSRPSPLLAALDPATGQLSTLPNTSFYGVEINAAVTMPNGDLVVAGYFGNTGQTLAFGIARFDGQNWSPIGNGVGQNVRALAVLPNGDLIAAGGFQLTGTPGQTAIARWDGSQWSALGIADGTLQTSIETTFVAANGDLIVGGLFDTVDGVPARNIARWNGSQWQAFGAGADATVRDVSQDTAGNLIVAGQFVSFDGVPCGFLVRQNGATWTPLFPPPAVTFGAVLDVQPLPDGRLVACGSTNSFSGAAVGIYAGGSWTSPPALGSVTTGAGIPRSLCALPDGSVVCGGLFRMAGDQPCNHVARLDLLSATPSWSTFGAGSNGQVRVVLRARDDTVYAGGDFTMLENVPAQHLARRTAGGSWQPFGAPINGSVHRIVERPDGEVFVSGSFTTIGGVAADRVARWDGSQWHAMGSGSSFEVNRMELDRSGDVIAQGSFPTGNTFLPTARWDGTAWQPFGSNAPLVGGGSITQLGGLIAATPAGDLLATAFTTTGPALVRWDGSAWHPFAPMPPTLGARLLPLPGGQLVFGDMIWDGASWQPHGLAGDGGATAPRPDGSSWLATNTANSDTNLYAGTPQGWQLVAEGVDFITTLATERDGTLWVGGSLLDFGGVGGAFLARLEPTCPAAVSGAGTGCLGAAGPLVQQADAFAFAGGTASAALSGAPAGALVLHTIGFAPQVLPLANVLPQALPNCTLWHTGDVVLGPAVATTAPTTLALTIPNAAALAGADYRTQAAVLELLPVGGLASLATSNALRWTIGSLQ
ncbi:MAG: hypothetical protein ACE37K_05280 [Planctomycetota bacterium]